MLNSKGLRVALKAFLDIAILIVATLASFWLRFDYSIPSGYLELDFMGRFLAVTLIARLSLFYFFGLYNRIWTYSSIDDLRNIVFSITLSTGLIGTYLFIDTGVSIPRSILPIQWVLTILGIGGVRLLVRMVRDFTHRSFSTGAGQRVLIVGAGDAGEMVLRELSKHKELNYSIVGLLDDHPLKQDQVIRGYRVLGGRHELREILQKYEVEKTIIAIPSAPGKVIREINDVCREEEVEASILPGVYELLSGEVDVHHLREVRLEDLLRREPIDLDMEKICEYIHDEVILITGGGGSIGSELVRQLARFHPACLVVMDASENNLYHIHKEMAEKYPGLYLVPVVGNVQDKGRLRDVFQKHRPQVIFHAAAYKHVPMMEANPQEAIKNNIFGTINTADMAHEFSSKRFVLVSTDKAVHPANIMGATKRVAEIIIQARDRLSDTEFVAVRFGNVLGSAGSAIPLFQEQIKKGGPITITHPDITRYFMTIPEASQLVIQAGSIAKGGEIFILDMGEPVRIMDLARDLIELSGLEPEKDIDIEIVGLRPGEKLYEELVMKEEMVRKTQHEKIFIGSPVFANEQELTRELKKLEHLLFREQGMFRDELRERMAHFYSPRETKQTTG